jgi:curved DNA-binding protein CbpA
MIASRREGEITFYDELGLAPDASAEEIRDAFRLNVRLLHPDQHTDPQLKEIAEAQMRKLNRIYSVLCDPERRREYDEMLDQEFGPPLILDAPLPNLGKMRARLVWGGAIIISAGLLIWLASDNTPAVQSRSLDFPAGSASQTSSPPAPLSESTAPSASSLEVAQLRASLRAAIVERDAAIHELERLRGAASGQSKSASSLATQEHASERTSATEPAPSVTLAELPATPRFPPFTPPAPPRADKPARTDKQANRQMGGFWFYARPPQGQINRNQTLYPPEYIEATITEDGTSVHGSFRARYVIVDRPISPDINFTFNGTQSGSQLSGAFTGAGGAKGDLTLRLTSENAMRIDWNASELGSFGLSSGTAVLTRRIE